MKARENTSMPDFMDTQHVTTALHRAAILARKIAIDTNTCLVIMHNGKITHVPPEQLRAQMQENKQKISNSKKNMPCN